MGSYATLSIGGLKTDSWKSLVPVEVALLFDSGDGAYSKIDGENVLFFRTTCGAARSRMDRRGITLTFCQRLFNEFRSETILEVDESTVQINHIANDYTFDHYLRFLSAALADGGWMSNAMEKRETELVRSPPDDFFNEGVVVDFYDALFFLQTRCILELCSESEVVELDLSDLWDGGYLETADPPLIYGSWRSVLLRRLELNYQLYGFLMADDPNVMRRLKQIVATMDEETFLQKVVLPLLSKMGFKSVRKVTHHGQGEFGRDIAPFRKQTEFGTLEYIAVQAKAVPIHGTSKGKGNAGELISQVIQALNVSFVDDLDNVRKRIDMCIIICNATITPSARRTIEESVEGHRRVTFLDLESVLALVLKHDLQRYIMFEDMLLPTDDMGMEVPHERNAVSQGGKLKLKVANAPKRGPKIKPSKHLP